PSTPVSAVRSLSALGCSAPAAEPGAALPPTFGAIGDCVALARSSCFAFAHATTRSTPTSVRCMRITISLDPHWRRARVDRRRLVRLGPANLADAQPIDLTALELPALVGGAEVLTAEARPLARQVEQRNHRRAELIRDRPTFTVDRGRSPDD